MIPLILLAIFGGFYALLYYLNSKAPVPEGAKKRLEDCAGCTISSCELHPSQHNMEEK